MEIINLDRWEVNDRGVVANVIWKRQSNLCNKLRQVKTLINRKENHSNVMNYRNVLLKYYIDDGNEFDHAAWKTLRGLFISTLLSVSINADIEPQLKQYFFIAVFSDYDLFIYFRISSWQFISFIYTQTDIQTDIDYWLRRLRDVGRVLNSILK